MKIFYLKPSINRYALGFIFIPFITIYIVSSYPNTNPAISLAFLCYILLSGFENAIIIDPKNQRFGKSLRLFKIINAGLFWFDFNKENSTIKLYRDNSESYIVSSAKSVTDKSVTFTNVVLKAQGQNKSEILGDIDSKKLNMIGNEIHKLLGIKYINEIQQTINKDKRRRDKRNTKR